MSLLEAQWEIIIRSVFKLVNATNLGMLFLLEDSVGNLYDPSTNYSSNSSRVLSQLYQVPFLDNESQDVARGQEKSQSNASIEKAVLLRPGSNFMIPFVFCSWVSCFLFGFISTIHFIRLAMFDLLWRLMIKEETGMRCWFLVGVALFS